jgi:hypothetical protein
MFVPVAIAVLGATGLLLWARLQQLRSESQARPLADQVTAAAEEVAQKVTSTLAEVPIVGKFFVNIETVKNIARAVAFAEGGYTVDGQNRNDGSRPSRNHNPGDLTADIGGNDIHPVGWDGPFAVYASDQEGWEDLYSQVILWLTGRSKVAGPVTTISELSTRYTATVGDQPAWAQAVANVLGVSADTELGQVT